MNQFNIIAGRVIRRRRKAAKLTQEIVADRIGLGRTAISNIEIGRNGMDLELFQQICDAIGCDPHETLAEIFTAAKGDYR